jgi:peptidoglycan/LPS O-acetylase OafA/YrhL
MKRLELLDYGRIAAALSVVTFHYFFNGIHNGKIATIHIVPEIVMFARYGYLGVDFFFMISGYVIFFSAANRSAGEFAASRLTRLYPAFWIAVLMTSVCALLWGAPLMTVTPAQVAANLTMAAPLLGYTFVDGVYWTLQLELAFYCLVLLALLIGVQRHLGALVLAWPVAMLVALAAGKAYLPYAGGYYAFFAAGAVLAASKERTTIISIGSTLVCIFLCVNFAAGESGALSASAGVPYSAAVIGTVVLAFFLFFFALNSRRGSSLSLPGSTLAGGLTYPIYLLHAHIGYMLLSRFGNDANRMFAYPAVFGVILLCSYLIYRFEQRYARQCNALFTCLPSRLLDRCQAATCWLTR